MNLKGIISIGGHSGLFKVVSQSKFGLIVESLIDGRRMPAYTSQKVSALADISIFTTDEDVPLSEVFKKIYEKENGKEAIDAKSSNEELKRYFKEVLPEYDEERVYVSDIKKVISWYNLLHGKDLLNKPEEEPEEESSAGEPGKVDNDMKKKEPKAAPKKQAKSAKAKEEKKPAVKKAAKVKETRPEANIKADTKYDVPNRSSADPGAKPKTKKGKTGV